MERLSLAIVDDEQETLQSLQRLFRRDYEVVLFDNVEKFLAHLEQQPVDIILSDIRMPFMDGFELMALIRDQYPATTRLCISGYADVERCQQAIEDGLFEFIIPKPWDNFELKRIISLFADNLRLKKQLQALIPRQDNSNSY